MFAWSSWKEIPMKDRSLFGIILFSMFLPGLFGQAPHFVTHPLPYEGGRIDLLFQENRGFILAGTSRGLFSFDGRNWSVITQSDSNSTKSVSAIWQDQDNRLWVGYKSGNIDIVAGGKTETFQPEEGTPVVPITGILRDKNGILWISTYGEGVYYYQNERLYLIDTDDGLPDNDVYVIMMDEEGRVWAGTDRGIGICSLEDGKKKVEVLSTKNGLPDNIVREISRDDLGNMWIGMYDGGIARYDLSKKEFISGGSWEYGAVTSILPLKDKIWIGTENSDIVLLEDSQPYRKIEAGQFQVYDILADKEGNIWISDHLNGLRSALRTLSFVPVDERIRSVHAGTSDRIWFSTAKGVYVFHRHTGQTDTMVTNLADVVVSMYEDPYGYLWMGSIGEGVWRMNIKDRSIRHFTEASGLVNNHVVSIDGDGKYIWFATFGGISRCQASGSGQIQFEQFTRKDGLSTEYIYQVKAGENGNAWFAMDGHGISIIENNRIRQLDELKDVTVFSMADDQAGSVWYNTEGQGIGRISLGNGDKSETELGISGEQALSIASLSRQLLLVVYPDYLGILNSSSGRMIRLGEEVGINNLGEDLNVVDQDAGGMVWIGGEDALVCYAPVRESILSTPLTCITSVNIYLENIGDEDPMELPYDRNHLSFNYTGLWYQAPLGVSYQHRLKGYDIDWVDSRNDQAIYPNLSPGTYTFELRSSANGDFSNVPVSSYSFRILKPFWEQWWFFLISILAGILIAYFWIKNREKRLRITERLEKENIESQFETLKSQINPHFLFNSFNTLISIIENDQETAVEYVERLSDFFRNILVYRHQTVIPLNEELELFENFYFLQKHRYGDNLFLNNNLDPSLAGSHTIPPLTLQLLVENALKHNIISKSKPLTVDIESDGKGYLLVRNNLQKRRDEVPSTQVGLQNIINRYRLLSDMEVRIEITRTHFQVYVPLLKKE